MYPVNNYPGLYRTAISIPGLTLMSSVDGLIDWSIQLSVRIIASRFEKPEDYQS